MLESVLDMIVDALEQAGIHAVREYPEDWLDRSQALVCVALRGSRVSPSGWGGYLGLETDSQGRITELYGARADMSIAADIYTPRAGAGSAALTMADCLEQALRTLPSGLKLKSAAYGQTAYDSRSDMFKCPCVLECSAFFVAEAGEDGEFADFILRGELRDGKQ